MGVAHWFLAASFFLAIDRIPLFAFGCFLYFLNMFFSLGSLLFMFFVFSLSFYLLVLCAILLFALLAIILYSQVYNNFYRH